MIRDDKVVYVGITMQTVGARVLQHAAKGKIFDSYRTFVGGVNKPAARGVEQSVIDEIGLDNLDNHINSISPSNPALGPNLEIAEEIFEDMSIANLEGCLDQMAAYDSLEAALHSAAETGGLSESFAFGGAPIQHDLFPLE